MKTFGSRRISSARASRTASAKVSSRVAVAVSGINVLVHLVGRGIGSVDGEFHRSIDLALNFSLDLQEAGAIRDSERGEILRHQGDGIAVGLPCQLFLFG